MNMPKVPDLPSGMLSWKNNVAGIVGAVAGIALVGGFPGIIGGLLVGEAIDYFYVKVRSCR